MQVQEENTSKSSKGCSASGAAPVWKASLKREIARLVLVSCLPLEVIGCCQPNDPKCRNVSFGPSGAEIAGVAIGVGVVVATAVAVGVHHANQTVDGCVSNGSSGMQLRTHSGAKTYLLAGDMTKISAGERVRLHGSKIKQPKHSETDQTFSVESEKKDYGPCKP